MGKAGSNTGVIRVLQINQMRKNILKSMGRKFVVYILVWKFQCVILIESQILITEGKFRIEQLASMCEFSGDVANSQKGFLMYYSRLRTTIMNW